MIDATLLRKSPEVIRSALNKRGVVFPLDELISIDVERRRLQKELDDMKHTLNEKSKEIGRLKRSGEDISMFLDDMKRLSEEISKKETRLREMEGKFYDVLLQLPNIPHNSVPVGKNENDNVEVKEWGSKPKFDFTPLPHWEIGEKLKILDFQRGTKISGSGFTLYTGLGARLEFALISFMLDIHVKKHKYTEVFTPFMVNEKSMMTTGQLPKFRDDMYKIEGENLYMIPTAEVSVVNIHRDEVIPEEELPKKYVAYSPCFRLEAGSYGQDVRGIIRQHQFNKVELVKFTTPEKSYDELELLLEDAEDVLKQLNLHYRVVALCTGDLGFSATKTYDIEVWMPAQNRYREISSVSNCEDFQARRGNIRYKKGKEKPRYLHTLNGSGLAVGRTVAALLENYQMKDGKVRIPDVLIPYMDGVEVIEP